jgi:hypothetical protein
MIVSRVRRCGSVVEHSIRNRAVAGSNPAIGFKNCCIKISRSDRFLSLDERVEQAQQQAEQALQDLQNRLKQRGIDLDSL